MRICRRVLTAVALALTVGLPSVASATDFFCGAGDVFCLIGSIQNANAGRGPDTIILQAGTYTFTVVDNTEDAPAGGGNALPSITGRVTIQGAGAADTILDGSHLLRLLHIAATGRVTLRGLTIQNAGLFRANGGAIFNRGRLTIAESVIRDNVSSFANGGGIYSTGTLRIVDSRLTNNRAGAGILGGGIWLQSAGELHVLRSTIEDNDADFGGGIAGTGTITIKDSVIGRQNSTGGGLEVGGTVTITNTTIANNTANGLGAGLVVSSGTARLTNVTIADNRADGSGGGLVVEAGSTVLMQNTILARNALFGRGQGPDCLGAITSLGNNIFANLDGCTVDLAPTDFVGEAGLGAFQDDGIPGHGHIPLLAESPAINAGNAEACPARDQLGISRQRRRGCDIGAVEFQP